MSKFYATLDTTGEPGRIDQNAYIVKFNTRAAAETYLRSTFTDDFTVEIGVGHYGDCWVKSHHAPKVGDRMIEPFSFTDVSIQRPGQHPGGNMYWIEPRREVLVAILIEKGE